MSDLKFYNVLNNSLWSYNSVGLMEDDYNNNPISIDIVDSSWRERMHQFMSDGPYSCDQLTSCQQNDHHYVNNNLYSDSYFQIILETHFDADQSDGTFITEKTWKPIKFGQPFVIIGPAGTLAKLRDEGYRVFDNVIDNSYDLTDNNTQRYVAVRNLLVSMQQQGVEKLFEQCLEDIVHNQQLFESRIEPLNILLEKISC
jgi:hypothetical protein